MTSTPTTYSPGERATAVCVHGLARSLAWLRMFQLLGSLIGFSCATQHAISQSSAPSENQLKGAFLVNFPKYVDWPAESFAETNSPIIVATLGETDLGDHLRKMIPGRTVNGRPLVFKVITENDPDREVHILFIPDTARRRQPAVLEKLKDCPVLTVGETDDFLSRGGVINLTRRDQKVRLEVNLAAARQAALKISSKLLSVADVVKGR